MLLRVRSNVGIWRVGGLDSNSSTIQNVLAEIAKTRPHVVYYKTMCSDPACTVPISNVNVPLGQLGLQHGSMIYCIVDPSTAIEVTEAMVQPETASSLPVSNDNATPAAELTIGKSAKEGGYMRRTIDADGRIKLVAVNELPRAGEEKGFRKGLMALRDIKMHWTLSDFVAMDSKYEFKIQRQKEAVCKQVSLDVPSIQKFQSFQQRFLFQRKRFGFLYGKFVDEGDNDAFVTEVYHEKKDDADSSKKLTATRVIVEAIYEPPQEFDSEAAEGFVPAEEDPWEDAVGQIAAFLGWTKVGWIYGHEAREPGFVMNAAEVIMAAEFQLEAAGGVNETPFVTVKVSPSASGQVSVEAFQVSQQCMAMVAEEALEVGSDPKFCYVNETFTAIQEGKASKTVENNFFLTLVPIVQHSSEKFIADFPSINSDPLDERCPSTDELKKQFSKSGTAGWTLVDRLADFNLLIFLSQFLDLKEDFPNICKSIIDRNIPLDDGYKILIKSMAGLEGTY